MGYFPLQIFIPIVHKLHWFLIVIARNKNIYILDSFPSKSREPVISHILSTLKQQLAKSTAGSDYIYKVPKCQQQKNKYASFTKTFFDASTAAASSLLWLIFFSYDCGFLVLLYIQEFDDTQAEQIFEFNKVIQQLMMHAVT